MNLNKVFTGLWAAIAMLLPGYTLAANSIKFEGTVSNYTCDVKVNGGSGSATVVLPVVNVSDFAAINARVAETAFTISVSKCDYPGTYVTPRFVGNNPRGSGHLLNNAGDGFAQGINLIVDYEPGGWGINLYNNWTAFAIENQAIRLSGTGSNRFGSRDYYVAYYRQGLSVVTPGKVRASMQYAILYP